MVGSHEKSYHAHQTPGDSRDEAEWAKDVPEPSLLGFDCTSSSLSQELEVSAATVKVEGISQGPKEFDR